MGCMTSITPEPMTAGPGSVLMEKGHHQATHYLSVSQHLYLDCQGCFSEPTGSLLTSLLFEEASQSHYTQKAVRLQSPYSMSLI